jgi:hypothetical protein
LQCERLQSPEQQSLFCEHRAPEPAARQQTPAVPHVRDGLADWHLDTVQSVVAEQGLPMTEQHCPALAVPSQLPEQQSLSDEHWEEAVPTRCPHWVGALGQVT